MRTTNFDKALMMDLLEKENDYCESRQRLNDLENENRRLKAELDDLKEEKTYVYRAQTNIFRDFCRKF